MAQRFPLYHRSDVTPYIHAFTNHFHEFIQKELNVNNFNLEGLEKLNDLTTQEYFKASNKRKSTVKQILSKRSRIEKLENTKPKTHLNQYDIPPCKTLVAPFSSIITECLLKFKIQDVGDHRFVHFQVAIAILD
ncbi:hypothetical protein BpHYR1_041171 [Brachionus plicatilis]|uniref:Uncharacterized protein n=1 Tax=Brachionus plicatilis TaxID=10195 RepID=A0A3M7PZE0_BRAPC|nr:hypothetical protein BpHYR1_041171 [Brachionus plicatilis]